MAADLIVRARSVVTMDEASPRAEAVAVDTAAGTIAAVGSLADCRAAAPGATERDLGDAVLLPGFVEAHSHPLLGGMVTQPPSHWIAPYVGYPAWSDVTALFEELDRTTPPGQPLLFNGVDRLLQQVDELDAAALDRHFPDRPVLVLDNSGHEAYFNSAVIRGLGWADGRPPADPTGGRFGRNDDGTSNGRAYEVPALAPLTRVLGDVVDHPLASAARWYRLMARNGITATSDMTYGSGMLPSYTALATTAGCPLRVSLYHMSTEDDCGDRLSGAAPEAMVRKQGIKLWADGSPWVGTLASSYPYLDSPAVRRAGIPLGPGGEAMMNYDRAQLDAILDAHAAEGWQMAFHVNGDVGLDVVLDAYERALAAHGLLGTDHRWRVEHCGGGRGDQFRRAAELGVAVSLGPFQFIYWGDLLDGELFPPEIGSQWMRWGDAIRAGARVSFHNDGPVSPPVPLLNVQAAVTRATPSGRVHGPEQVVDLDQALRCQTIDAAYTLHRDHEIGSISPGKLADFVELSADPYEADPARLTEQVEVLGTWLGGHRVDADAFVAEVEAADPAPHRHLTSHPRTCC